MVSLKDIREAGERIRRFVHKTPLVRSDSLSRMTGAEVFLKAENLQKTGSFKVRGAVNKISGVHEERVIAASMGNHAQGVAFAASRLGKQARIVMPVTASIVKQEATRGYGAEVILYGESFQEALDHALSQEGFGFIHAFDDDEVICGQGTVGLEILEELGDPDVLLVPVGGGGLIAGIATAVKSLSPGTEVIGVQTAQAPSAHMSFREKKISAVRPQTTIADGIAVGRIGERPFAIMLRRVDDMVLVSEDPIAAAVLLFLERKKLVVEGAGAVPLAALISHGGRFRGKKVVLVVSGGNIDPTLIDRIIHRGLVTAGRVGVIGVIVEDVPGRLQAVSGIISSHRGNILSVHHDRLSRDLPFGKTRLEFTVEGRGAGHLEEILSDMAGRGFEVERSECA